LSFKQKRELAELPGQIAVRETEKAALESRLATPDPEKGPDPNLYAEWAEKLAVLDQELEALYERWVELSSIEGE
jgi:ATP-binding cassette subfamily F protein uup